MCDMFVRFTVCEVNMVLYKDLVKTFFGGIFVYIWYVYTE